MRRHFSPSPLLIALLLCLAIPLTPERGHAQTPIYSSLPDLTVAKERSDPRVYVIVGGAKLWISDPGSLCSYYGCWANVAGFADGSLANITTQPRDFTLVSAIGAPEVYLVAGGTRYWIPDEQTMICHGWTWEMVRKLGPVEVARIPFGPHDVTRVDCELEPEPEQPREDDSCVEDCVSECSASCPSGRERPACMADCRVECAESCLP